MRTRSVTRSDGPTMPPQPDPRLFIVASLAVCALLVCFTWRTYGPALATGLLAALAVGATWKEIAIEPLPYEVLLVRAKPLGIPVGIIVGWLVTSMLALEFARRVGSLLPRRLARRVGPRLLLGALYAGWMARAVEPVGQAAGWWRWVDHLPGDPPVLAQGDWAVNVVILCVIAYGFAPAVRRLGPGGVAAASGMLALVLTSMSTALLALNARIPPPVVAFVFVFVPLAWLVVRGFTVAPGLLDPPARHRMRPLERCLPIASVAIVVSTLAHYATATGQPTLTAYAERLWLGSLAVFGPDVGLAIIAAGRGASSWFEAARGPRRGVRPLEHAPPATLPG